MGWMGRTHSEFFFGKNHRDFFFTATDIPWTVDARVEELTMGIDIVRFCFRNVVNMIGYEFDSDSRLEDDLLDFIGMFCVGKCFSLAVSKDQHHTLMRLDWILSDFKTSC